MRVSENRGRKPHHRRSACSVQNAGSTPKRRASALIVERASISSAPSHDERSRTPPLETSEAEEYPGTRSCATPTGAARDRLSRQESRAEVEPTDRAQQSRRPQPERAQPARALRAQKSRQPLARDHLDGLRDDRGSRRHRRVRLRPDSVRRRRTAPSGAARRRAPIAADTSGSYAVLVQRANGLYDQGAQAFQKNDQSAGAQVLRRRRQGLQGSLEAAGHRPERGHGLRDLALLLGRHGRRAEAGERGPRQEPGLPDGPPQQGRLPRDRRRRRPETAVRRPRRIPCWRRPRPRTRRRCPSIPARAPAPRRRSR